MCLLFSVILYLPGSCHVSRLDLVQFQTLDRRFGLSLKVAIWKTPYGLVPWAVTLRIIGTITKRLPMKSICLSLVCLALILMAGTALYRAGDSKMQPPPTDK